MTGRRWQGRRDGSGGGRCEEGGGSRQRGEIQRYSAASGRKKADGDGRACKEDGIVVLSPVEYIGLEEVEVKKSKKSFQLR
ncbi:hypothetical protein E3N88_11704 [Mikania micrantha]|uniref:Uncharacterized protein n=1 Tax=Mikania micrantha TaxID=192012 RepID=A0A5N6P6G7_9ASTR|nr:hypothetical protein E3N88_11704 [Mikania micrantha]